MTTKQIGYPAAGVAWHVATRLKLNGWAWTEGTGAGAPRRADWGILPPDVASMGVRSGGDITGAQGSKRKRARAVGAGEDAEQKRAREFNEWLDASDTARKLSDMRAAMDDPEGATERAQLAAVTAELLELQASRAAIVAQVRADGEEGQRILTLAGGAGWGDGRKLVTLNGGGMAARAARYVFRMGRGVQPSETSLQEAASAAAASMWFEWQVYSALCGDVWNVQTIRHLASYGWRAAFQSLTRDASEGRTGRKAGQVAESTSIPLDAAQLQIEATSLQAWANDRQGRIFDGGEDDGGAVKRARREALKWIASVLDVKAKGRTGAAERARFSLLARLMHGRDIATAARGAGFASGRAAIESFRSGKVWPRLRAAVAAHVGERERALIAIRARAVAQAMAAIKAQRATRAGAGRADHAAAAARSVILASGAASIVYPAGVSQTAAAVAGAGRLTRPAIATRRAVKGLAGRGSVHPQARAWAQATTARGEAVATARAARAVLVATRRERVDQFDAATKGYRAGWLR